MYNVINPASGIIQESYDDATDYEIERSLNAAANAFPNWRDTSVSSRASCLGRVSELMMDQQDYLAQLITSEMGKPITAARGEVENAANIIRYYADHVEAQLSSEYLGKIGGADAYVERRPVGVILGIMPWNFPYYQVARFAGPVLATGNTVLLKHAHQCPTSALALERIFFEALSVPDAYVNIFANDEQVSSLIKQPQVQGVSVTGSERAGSAVAAEAGKALKKVVLELGGSDPFIVLDDHNLEEVAAAAVNARLNNGGQACAAPKRFIVHDDVFDRFADRFTQGMESIEARNPEEPGTVSSPGFCRG